MKGGSRLENLARPQDGLQDCADDGEDGMVLPLQKEHVTNTLGGVLVIPLLGYGSSSSATPPLPIVV
jgi:hypothetical protein